MMLHHGIINLAVILANKITEIFLLWQPIMVISKVVR
jgi:hypothetical protein